MDRRHALLDRADLEPRDAGPFTIWRMLNLEALRNSIPFSDGHSVTKQSRRRGGILVSAFTTGLPPQNIVGGRGALLKVVSESPWSTREVFTLASVRRRTAVAWALTRQAQ